MAFPPPRIRTPAGPRGARARGSGAPVPRRIDPDDPDLAELAAAWESPFLRTPPCPFCGAKRPAMPHTDACPAALFDSYGDDDVSEKLNSLFDSGTRFPPRAAPGLHRTRSAPDPEPRHSRAPAPSATVRTPRGFRVTGSGRAGEPRIQRSTSAREAPREGGSSNSSAHEDKTVGKMSWEERFAQFVSSQPEGTNGGGDASDSDEETYEFKFDSEFHTPPASSRRAGNSASAKRPSATPGPSAGRASSARASPAKPRAAATGHRGAPTGTHSKTPSWASGTPPPQPSWQRDFSRFASSPGGAGSPSFGGFRFGARNKDGTPSAPPKSARATSEPGARTTPPRASNSRAGPRTGPAASTPRSARGSAPKTTPRASRPAPRSAPVRGPARGPTSEERLASAQARKAALAGMTAATPPSIAFSDIPWIPMDDRGESIHLLDLGVLPGAPVSDRKGVIREAIRKWHPDKFVQSFGHALAEEDRERILQRVKAVAQALNALMAIHK